MKTITAIFDDFGNTALLGSSIFFAVVKTYFLKYIFADFAFAGFLFTLVFFDLILGVVFAFKEKDFDPKEFGEFLIKVIVYMAVLNLGHVLSNYTVNDKPVETFAFVRHALYSGMIIREGASILKFSGRKYPGIFREVLKYFRGYTAEGLPEQKIKNSDGN